MRTTTLGATSTFGVGGLEGALDASLGHSQGYPLRVGHEALFIGWIVPVPDDPATPEDEYPASSYAFSPLVSRHRYLDVAGAEAGFYVLTYAMGR